MGVGRWAALGAAFVGQPLSAAPVPVFDVHMHAPRTSDNDQWVRTMNELGVTQAVLLGVPSQLAQPPASSAQLIPSLMFP